MPADLLAGAANAVLSREYPQQEQREGRGAQRRRAKVVAIGRRAAFLLAVALGGLLAVILAILRL